jgi:hypothetical protein
MSLRRVKLMTKESSCDHDSDPGMGARVKKLALDINEILGDIAREEAVMALCLVLAGDVSSRIRDKQIRTKKYVDASVPVDLLAKIILAYVDMYRFISLESSEIINKIKESGLLQEEIDIESEIKLNLNDKNTSYMGDGVYAHTDEHHRIWIVTYNGISISNQICLEDEVFGCLVRFYDRIKQDG